MEGAELDGHTGPDADQRRQRALRTLGVNNGLYLTPIRSFNYLVKGQWTFIFEDVGCAAEGIGILGRRLQSYFDNI